MYMRFKNIKDLLNNVDLKIGNYFDRINFNYNKVFCIGLHKTGTTSLSNCFKQIGLKSIHNTKWSQKPIPNKYLNNYTTFSDGGGHIWFENFEFGGNHQIRLLDENFPNSKYILNYRHLKPWVSLK